MDQTKPPGTKYTIVSFDSDVLIMALFWRVNADVTWVFQPGQAVTLKALLQNLVIKNMQSAGILWKDMPQGTCAATMAKNAAALIQLYAMVWLAHLQILCWALVYMGDFTGSYNRRCVVIELGHACRILPWQCCASIGGVHNCEEEQSPKGCQNSASVPAVRKPCCL